MLYCLVGGHIADGDPSAVTYLIANGQQRLLTLDPGTLQPDRERTLPEPVRALAGDVAAAGVPPATRAEPVVTPERVNVAKGGGAVRVWR